MKPSSASELFRAMEDTALWDLFRAGNADAYAHIYQQHIQDLYQYGMHLHPDHPLVQDSIQEVFVNVWKNRKNLGKTNCIRYYLFKALRHQLLKLVSRQQRRVSPDWPENAEVDFPFESKLISEEAARQRHRQLAEAIRKLPARQREVVYLVFYKNIPQEEIAAMMSITIQSVYTLTWKAVRSLKKHLKYILVLIIAALPSQF